jgi:hypothetical protein
MPGRKCFGEVTSGTNCLDYQARRLNIRYKVHSMPPVMTQCTAMHRPHAVRLSCRARALPSPPFPLGAAQGWWKRLRPHVERHGVCGR